MAVAKKGSSKIPSPEATPVTVPTFNTENTALDALLQTLWATPDQTTAADAVSELRAQQSQIPVALLLPLLEQEASRLPDVDALADQPPAKTSKASQKKFYDNLVVHRHRAAVVQRLGSVLAASQDPAAEASLLSLWRTHPHAQTVSSIARNLLGIAWIAGPLTTRYNEPPSSNALRELANDFDREVQTMTPSRTGVARVEIVTNALVQCDEADALIRFAKLLATPEAFPTLTENLAQEPIPTPVSAFLDGLTQCTLPTKDRWCLLVRPLLEANTRSIRCSALSFFAAHYDEQVLDSIAPLLSNGDPWIRSKAEAIMKKFPSPRWITPVLERLRRNPKEQIGAMDLVRLLVRVGNADTARQLIELLPSWGVAMHTHVALQELPKLIDPSCREVLEQTTAHFESNFPQWPETSKFRALLQSLS